MANGMALKKLAILSILPFVFIACASHGSRFNIQNANKVTNGMTREQVIAIMGSKPYSIQNQGKTFIWSYARVNTLTGSTQSRAVRFNFDENGKTYGVPEGGVYGDTEKYMR